MFRAVICDKINGPAWDRTKLALEVNLKVLLIHTYSYSSHWRLWYVIAFLNVAPHIVVTCLSHFCHISQQIVSIHFLWTQDVLSRNISCAQREFMLGVHKNWPKNHISASHCFRVKCKRRIVTSHPGELKIIFNGNMKLVFPLESCTDRIVPLTRNLPRFWNTWTPKDPKPKYLNPNPEWRNSIHFLIGVWKNSLKLCL